MTSAYFLSIGSNIQPEKNIPLCLALLKEHFLDIHFSSVYETPPVGPVGDSNFWNLGAQLKSPLSLEEIRTIMVRLEERLGRVRDPDQKNSPRIIDIDVLPKEGYEAQAFVVIPLAETFPDAMEPLSKKTFRELAEMVKEDAKDFKVIQHAKKI